MKEYFPQRFLTESFLSELLPQLKLDVSYEIEEDLPDGIEVVFPHSSIYFTEYEEGEIAVYFLASQIGTERDLSLADAISIVATQITLADEYPIKEHIPFASKQKVANQIKNYFYVIKKYLHPYLLGDYSWVYKYQEKENLRN